MKYFLYSMTKAGFKTAKIGRIMLQTFGLLAAVSFLQMNGALALVKDQKPIIIAVVEDSPKADFEQKTLPILKEAFASCSACEVKNLSPYTADGTFDTKALEVAVLACKDSASILYLGWNRPLDTENKKVVESLKSLIQQGVFVVGFTGVAQESEPTSNLNKTVLGQVPDAVIIGELKERETLIGRSYYGPEMLTAIQPPKEFLGQGKVTLFFVGRLAQNWNRRQASEWLGHFRETKAKSRKIWPALEDFFRR